MSKAASLSSQSLQLLVLTELSNFLVAASEVVCVSFLSGTSQDGPLVRSGLCTLAELYCRVPF